MADDPKPKISRYVQPLGPRVLVRIIPSDDRTSAGLFLPPGAKDATAEAVYAEVVEVARATEAENEGFGTNVSGIPEGAKVLFSKGEGVPIPWDETLRLVAVKDVLAIIEEVTLDKVN